MSIRGVGPLGQYHAIQPAAQVQKIDEILEQALKEWGIPGISLAIVHKGEDVRIAGYGVKERGGRDAVDADTLFQICSLTKAFTGLTVSMLVQEGRLKLDERVCTYLPTFQLKDPEATEKMTLRDLLSHRTGLPGIPQESWRLWWHTGRSVEDLTHRLAHVEPAFSFRSHFTYNNMAYVIASQVVAKVAGVPWQQFCKERIFGPLGMERTHTSYELLSQDQNVASSHLLPNILERPIALGNFENLAAAAGINSSATDMALWLKHCLSNSAAVKETQKPCTLMEAKGFLEKELIPTWSIYARGLPTHYGLGWMSYTLDDKTVLFHTGLGDGVQTILAVIPEEELGVAILSNEMGHMGTACLLNLLIDHLLGRESVDWNQKARDAAAEINQFVEKHNAQIESTRLKDISPSLKPNAYTGEYKHLAYGSILIGMENEVLTLKLFSDEEGQLEHWQEDQFKITGVDSAPELTWLLEFQLSQDQRAVTGLKMPNLGVFERVDL